MLMGGNQVPGGGTGDDGYDEDGYDESQRAEILEATRDGPSDGTILTDIAPDMGEDDTDDEQIDIDGAEATDGSAVVAADIDDDDDLGDDDDDDDDDDLDDDDDDLDGDEDDLDEDEVQEDFDKGTLSDDDDLDDPDSVALRP